jgi:hypothetical protein
MHYSDKRVDRSFTSWLGCPNPKLFYPFPAVLPALCFVWCAVLAIEIDRFAWYMKWAHLVFVRDEVNPKTYLLREGALSSKVRHLLPLR